MLWSGSPALPPPLLLPLSSGYALGPVVLCRVLLSVWCCAALCRRACVVQFSASFVRAISDASGCGVLLCPRYFPLALCGALVLPSCVVWSVVVPYCPVLCPVVLCCLLVPCCRAVLCVCLCCVLLLFLFPLIATAVSLHL